MRSGGRHTEYERGSSIGCGWSMAGVCGTHPWSRIALLSATANLVQFPNFIIFQVGSAWLTKWILAAFLISKSEELRVGPLPQSFETARDSPIICSLHMFLVLLQLDAWYSSFMPMFVPSPVRTSALYAPVSHFASLMLALIDSLVMFWWNIFPFCRRERCGSNHQQTIALQTRQVPPRRQGLHDTRRWLFRRFISSHHFHTRYVSVLCSFQLGSYSNHTLDFKRSMALQIFFVPLKSLIFRIGSRIESCC